jgi:hypothetical protein
MVSLMVLLMLTVLGESPYRRDCSCAEPFSTAVKQSKLFLHTPSGEIYNAGYAEYWQLYKRFQADTLMNN